MKAFLARALVVAFPCVAMAQIAVLQIKVLDGEGVVHPAGARIAHPLTVEVTDETGRPVAGAAVSFQLPPDGPSGLFPNGLRTDLVLTDASGRASLHSMQLNRTGGQFRIRITAVKEQARAGAVSLQYIGETHTGNNNVASTPSAKPSPDTSAQAPSQAAAQTPSQAPSQNGSEITPTVRTTPQASPGSAEITPTTTKMGSGSHKKWIVIAAIAAGAGIAFLGVSRAAAAAKSSTVSSSVVSIGTPTITVGKP
jgi:hypothetical protein